MSAVEANLAVGTNENKSSKRKKNKGDAAATQGSVSKAPLSDITASATNGVDSAANGGGGGGGGVGEGGTESPYIKELNKNCRNLRKRLINTQKVDSIIAENPGKSLDELYSERKINADQKKQAENKPALQSQLKQLEEQLEHYKKFEEDLQKRYSAEKEAASKEHDEALEKAKEEAYEKGKSEGGESVKSKLLTLSRFLRAAAARRQADEKAPVDAAFEGALLLVYGGDVNAVEAMQKLIEGDEEKVMAVEGESTEFSFKHIRDVALEQTDTAGTTAETADGEATNTGEMAAPIESDPTLVHASLTEIEQEAQPAPEIRTSSFPEAAMVDADASNAAATAITSPPAHDLAASGTSDAWVEVPRDPAETETGVEGHPSAPTQTTSWAEDVPVPGVSETAAAPAAQSTNDGFSEVVHHHRGGRGRGGRGGGEYRGRGGRGGEYRGRGRGGYRGDGEGRSRGRGRGGYRGRGGGGGGGGGYGGAGGAGGEGGGAPAQ